MSMSSIITPDILKDESDSYRGTGGISEENRENGFVPAFQDCVTGDIYISRFADGRIAPIHILDGLPSALIHARGASGKAIAVKKSVIPGFVRGNQFFTREEAAAAIKTSA